MLKEEEEVVVWYGRCDDACIIIIYMYVCVCVERSMWLIEKMRMKMMTIPYIMIMMMVSDVPRRRSPLAECAAKCTRSLR